MVSGLRGKNLGAIDVSCCPGFAAVSTIDLVEILTGCRCPGMTWIENAVRSTHLFLTRDSVTGRNGVHDESLLNWKCALGYFPGGDCHNYLPLYCCGSLGVTCLSVEEFIPICYKCQYCFEKSLDISPKKRISRFGFAWLSVI